MKRSRNLHLGASPPPSPASKNSDCVAADRGFEGLHSDHNFPHRGTESVMSLDGGADAAVAATTATARGRGRTAAATAILAASLPGRQRKDTSMLSVDCSFAAAAADTPTTRCGQKIDNMTTNSHKTRSNQTMMMCDDDDDRGASRAVAVSDILSLGGPPDIDAGSARQVSFDRHRLAPPAASTSSNVSMSGTAGLTPSTSAGSYSGIRSMSSSSAAGCCMTDVTSSFLSMSPCSAATEASGIPGWSPVSVTSTSASTSMRPSQHIDSDVAAGRSAEAATCTSWRDNNGDGILIINNNNKRSSSGSDSRGRTTCTSTFGKIRSNRKKRSLRRQPPSKCLSSLAAGVSILESDGDDNCCNDSGSDSDEDSFPSTTNRTGSTDPFSSDYCYDGRSSFNTRPYKRQPSSCEWDHHGSGSVSVSGSHRAPNSSRCSSSNVSGTDAGSVSPCFSHASSNGEQQTGTAMSPLFLSQSAPSGLVGEWGQFVDVISADERGGSTKKERPQPLAFSPGLGGLRCIPGSTVDTVSSSSATTADASTKLPYFPKSRRRGSSGRVTLRRRASSVGSHHDVTPTGSTGSGNRRRFAITARFAGGARSAVARAHSSSLFLQDTSIQGKTSGGPSPPPPSPSLGPMSVRQGSGKSTTSEQPLTPRPSLDDVSFAMDNMQV